MTSTYYESNIAHIQERNWLHLPGMTDSDPLPCELSRSRKETLRYEDSYIHSPYDPIAEAKKLVRLENPDSCSLVFVVGLGYGYHVKEVLNQLGDRDSLVFVFEWSKEIFTSAIHFADLGFLKDERVHLYVGDGFWDQFHGVLLSVGTSSVRGSYVLYLKSEYKLFKVEYDGLIGQVNDIIQQEFQNRLTSLEFEKLWVKNMILNSANLSRHRDISCLFNGFAGYSAVIASAGPSLRESLLSIKKYRDNIILFATDTALNCLLELDISADFIVSIDGQFHNYKDFWTYSAKGKSILLYDLSVYPAIPNWITGEKFYFSSSHRHNTHHPYVDWLQSFLNLNITAVNTGSSVASTAIELSRLMGFSHIILTGQDLSYTDLMSHCPGTPHYERFLIQSNRLNTMESKFYRMIHQRKLSSSPENPAIKTDFVLSNLHKWIENYALRHQVISENKLPLLLNATDRGISIQHVPNVSLAEIIECQGHKQSMDEQGNSFVGNLLSGMDGACSVSRELFDMYQILYYELEKFLVSLNEDLDIEIELDNHLMLSKNSLERKYPFLALIYEKEDLWYKRKSNHTNDDRFIYANILLRVTKHCLSWLSLSMIKLKDLL